VPTIDDFLKSSKNKKFSKASEENWKVDVSPPQIDNRRRPGRRPHLQPFEVSPTPPPESDSVAKPAAEVTQEQSSLDPAVTAEHPLPDSETTREPKRGIENRAQPGTTTGHNRAQISIQPGTTGHKQEKTTPKPGTSTGHNRAQSKDQKGSTGHGVQKSNIQKRKETKIANIDNQLGTTTGHNRAQQPGTNELVPGLDESSAQLNDDLYPVKEVGNRAQPDTVPGLIENRARLQLNTTTGHNRAQQPDTTGHKIYPSIERKKSLPTSVQQLKILNFILKTQQQTGLGYTPRMKRFYIANSIGISVGGIKTQLKRLCDSGFLKRIDARDGRGEAGTVYQLPEEVTKAMVDSMQPGTPTGYNRAQITNQPGTLTGHNNGTQQDVVSSSSLINTTTTVNTDPVEDPGLELSNQFQEIIKRLRLDEHGVGSNDLLSLWRRVLQRKGLFKNFSDLEQSLEHLAFYLGTKDAEGLKHPKAWMLRELERGYYPEPAGFQSREEIQEESRLDDARKKKERLKKIRQERFDVEFESWLLELPAERKNQIVGVVSLGSRATKAMLRAEFAKEIGFDLQGG